MTLELLQQPLIQKYFGCLAFGCNAETEGEPEHRSGLDCNRSVAYRILLAMGEPINPGEKYLFIERMDHVYVTSSDADQGSTITGFRQNRLRLPCKFQTVMDCECKELRNLGCGCWVGLNPCGTHTCIHQPPRWYSRRSAAQPPAVCFCDCVEEEFCPKHKKPKAPKGDVVEKKMEEVFESMKVVANDPSYTRFDVLSKDLRELVALARKEKR